MGLLDFQGVTKYYGERLLLNDISFSVERGERLAMIGPNGAGKTTLMRIAMGEEHADIGGVAKARGIKAGFLTQDLNTLAGEDNALHWNEFTSLERRIHALEEKMAVAQDKDLSPLMHEYEKLTTRFELMDGYTIESQLKATLLGLGLREEALGTPLANLSSGERMRVALARILLKSPDLLVLDEPTNHLDIAATLWLEEYLLNFSGGVLIISHDRYFLDRVATRIVELRGGTILVHHGNYSSFLQQQDIRNTYLRSERERLDREIRSEQELARRLRATAHIPQARSREKGIERLKTEREQLTNRQRDGHLGRITAPGLNLKAPAHSSAEIAVAEHATKRIGNRTLFQNVNFLIQGGERVAFIGPNGCGKTTLLRILLGLDEDYQGKMKIGEWVTVGLLDQNTVFEDERRSMIEEIIAAKEQTEVEAKKILSKVGFYGDETYKTIDKLSGGERVRLKLALLLLTEPQCLVLDEPTNHLDLPAREAVEQALTTFHGSVIAVSHDRYFLNRCVRRIMAFEGTRIVSYRGNWDAYRQTTQPTNGGVRPEPTRKHPPQKKPPQKPLHKPPAQPPARPRTQSPAQSSAQIEAHIQMLETKKQYLEQLMGPTAAPEIYTEYAQTMTELETLYEAWTAVQT